jgi:hypothetical protein
MTPKEQYTCQEQTEHPAADQKVGGISWRPNSLAVEGFPQASKNIMKNKIDSSCHLISSSEKLFNLSA